MFPNVSRTGSPLRGRSTGPRGCLPEDTANLHAPVLRQPVLRNSGNNSATRTCIFRNCDIMGPRKRHPEPLPARAGPVRNDPDSADRRGVPRVCLARAIRRANRAAAIRAPPPAQARAGYARIRVPPLPGRRRGERNGVERNEMREQHAGCRRTRLRGGRQDTRTLLSRSRERPGEGQRPCDPERPRQAERQPSIPTLPRKRRRVKEGRSPCPNRLQDIRHVHAEHDIS